MKTKKLKSLTILTPLLTLCAVLLGAGCDDEENNYDPVSIIGKWEWLYSHGGFTGTTYPKEGQTVTLEFTEDSTLIERKNGETTFETEYYVSEDTLKYFRGEDLQYRIDLKEDTLVLYFIIDGFDNFYKRIK